MKDDFEMEHNNDSSFQNRRRKRSYDKYEGDNNESSYNRYNSNDGYDHGGYKRSRMDNSREGGRNYRPRHHSDHHNRRDNDRYNNSRYGGNRFSNGSREPDHERSWRLAKRRIIELGTSNESNTSVNMMNELEESELQEHLTRTAEYLLHEIDMNEDQAVSRLEDMASLIVQCAGRLSSKTSLYAVLVGLLNVRNRTIAERILTNCIQELQKDIDYLSLSINENLDNDNDTFRKEKNSNVIAQRIRLLLRFLGELVSTYVVKSDDILGLLDTFQSVCIPEEFTSDIDQETLRTRENAAAFKDIFAFMVLDVLVYCGATLEKESEEMYASLFSRCKEYVEHRVEESNPRGLNDSHQAKNWLVRRIRLQLLWEPEESEETLSSFCQELDPLSIHWNALNDCKAQAMKDDRMALPNSRWSPPGIIHIQSIFQGKFDRSITISLTNSVAIDSSTFEASKLPHYAVLPRVITKEAGAAGAALANLPTVSTTLIRQQFSDTLEAMYPKPVMAAKSLLGLAKCFNSRIESSSSSALSTSSAVKTEYYLLEIVVTASIGTYISQAQRVYYSAVLYHLVKRDAPAMSPALAIVMELLFRHVPLMNAGPQHAYMLLFSHFLSNFEYKWPWSHWAHVLDYEQDDPQRLFVAAVIERCVRLSYLQHMQSILPAEFHVLLPPTPTPRIRYKSANGAGETEDEVKAMQLAVEGVVDIEEWVNSFYGKIKDFLELRPSSSGWVTWLTEAINHALEDHSDASESSGLMLVEAIWTSLLIAGEATFTHARLMIEKYGKLVFSCIAKEIKNLDQYAYELAIIKAVGVVWIKSPQHITVILNMMIQEGLIQGSTIAKWIFTPDVVQQYSWPYVWEVLESTLSCILDRIRQTEESPLLVDEQDDIAMDETEQGSAITKRNLAKSDLQQSFVILFEGFNRVVTEYKATCQKEGRFNEQDNWFQSTIAQFKHLGARFRVPMLKYNVFEELQNGEFSSKEIDNDVKVILDILCDSYAGGVHVYL